MTTRRRTIAFAVALITGAFLREPAGADDNCAKAACTEVKEKIRNLESRMRSGYTRAQGEKYRQRLRELRAKQSKLCR